jgi:hypothetical protein
VCVTYTIQFTTVYADTIVIRLRVDASVIFSERTGGESGERSLPDRGGENGRKKLPHTHC